MRKFLSLGLLLASIGVATFSAEAKTSPVNNLVTNSETPQVRIQIGRGRQRRNWTTTTVRTVRRGRALYRETYRVTHYWNGRVNTRLISRIRIR